MLTNLKTLRDEYNISQKKLADALSTTQQAINKYENHRVQPDIETLKKIADYFDTSIDYLLGYTDIRKKIGAAGEYNLSDFEAELIERIRLLSEEEKQCVDTVVRTLQKKR